MLEHRYLVEQIDVRIVIGQSEFANESGNHENNDVKGGQMKSLTMVVVGALGRRP